MFPRIPVTVLTGPPGSRNALLLREILGESDARGEDIAVIQDDPDSLGPALSALARTRKRVARVLLEMRGLSSPGGVVRSLSSDRELREHYVLDGIVTVVDAQQLPRQLDESVQICEQVAFADLIVINETGLVCEAELAALVRRLRAMNGIARIERAHGAVVPRESMLRVGRDDPTRKGAGEPLFRSPEYPFAWAGLYTCEAGAYRLEMRPGPAPTVSVVVLPVEGDDEDAIGAATEGAALLFSACAVDRASGQVVLSGAIHQRLVLKPRETTYFHLVLPRAGRYVLFSQHLPQELNLMLTGAAAIDERHFLAEDAYGDPVKCVRLTVEQPLHAARFQHWLERLLRGGCGGDLLRMQGCLNFAGTADRIVIQGIQQSIETRASEPWGDRTRATQLVLIGRDLARGELLCRLQACATAGARD